MDRLRRQDHAVAWLQLETFALALQHECDGAVDAVQDLFEVVAMGRITVARTVRPLIAAARFGAQLAHQLFEGRHLDRF